MLKSKFARVAALAVASIAPMLATVAADASYTGTINDQLTVADKQTVDQVMNVAFEGSVDAGYTSISYLLYFVTQPTVLSVLVAIGLIYFGGGFAIGWVKSIFKGRKNKRSAVK